MNEILNMIYKNSKVVGGIISASSAMGIFYVIGGDFFDNFITNIIYILVLGAFFYWGIKLFQRDKLIKAQNEARQRNYNNYVDSIKPDNAVRFMELNIDSNDAYDYLGHGNSTVNFMFINNYRVITFPESGFGNNVGYYLVNVKFSPMYNQNIDGNTRSNGGFNYDVDDLGGNTYSNGSFSGVSTKEEVPSDAFLTFARTDLSTSFTIRLVDVNSNEVNKVIQYFLLNKVEQSKLHIN